MTEAELMKAMADFPGGAGVAHYGRGTDRGARRTFQWTERGGWKVFDPAGD